MKFQDLASIPWDELETTTDWTKLLNLLLSLAEAPDLVDFRGDLADALDTFIARSSSDDLRAMAKLDRVADKAGRALRLANMEASVAQLEAASMDFQNVTKELTATALALAKEAKMLRADRVKEAISSLTDSVVSLKSLSDVLDPGHDTQIADAISKAVASAQKLRALLEKPS